LAADTVANKQLGSFFLMGHTQFCMGYVLILSVEETAVVGKYFWFINILETNSVEQCPVSVIH
jgi:hypothetical protein